MQNVFNWLPIQVDESTKDICRKWACHSGQHSYNEGSLIDATKFIPRTSKATAQKQQYLDNSSLNNLERWVLQNSDGNRNNSTMRYALALVDSGKPQNEVEHLVLEMNKKFKKPLKLDEIQNTVFKSVQNKLMQREAG